MTPSFTLDILLRNHRTALVFIVVLSILESLLFVAQFYFIGEAINDLMRNSWLGFYILCGLFAGKILISYFKQKKIGKTYKIIYDRLISDSVVAPIIEGVDVAYLLPKSTIIYILTDFFKGDLIKGFETFVRLIFVLLALVILNKTLFAVAVGMSVVVFALYFIRRKKTVKLSRELANEFVQEYPLMMEGKTEELLHHHKQLERFDKGLSRISAVNLSIIEILSFVFILVAIVMLVNTEGENALGTFFSMLYYVMAFSETMYLLPSVYQKYLRMQEASKKI